MIFIFKDQFINFIFLLLILLYYLIIIFYHFQDYQLLIYILTIVNLNI